MLVSKVASNYAHALCAVASENNILDDIEKDLTVFFDLITLNKKLKEMLDNPLIFITKKNEVIEKLFLNKFNFLTISFLRFVFGKRRISILPTIFTLFKEYSDIERKIITITIILAKPLNEAMKEKIIDRLRVLTRKTIKLKVIIDSKSIAGIAIRINDECYDGTVKRKLEVLKSFLLKKHKGV